MTVYFTFISALMLLNPILHSGYAQQQEQGVEEQTLQRICSRCHALEIAGKCAAGNCDSPKVVRLREPRPWDQVLDRMVPQLMQGAWGTEPQ